MRCTALSPDVPAKNVWLSALTTPATGATGVPSAVDNGMLPSVPGPVACGVYVGTTPPVPIYVTNAVSESEVGKTPVIAVAVTPGSAPLNTGFVVKSCGVASGSGQLPIGRPDGMARSVNAVVVAPRTCRPSLVVATRLLAGAIQPASAEKT